MIISSFCGELRGEISRKDERLAIFVRKYRRLHDNTYQEFEDRNITSIIGGKVANELRLKSGKK